jgi:hypothetical protein
MFYSFGIIDAIFLLFLLLLEEKDALLQLDKLSVRIGPIAKAIIMPDNQRTLCTRGKRNVRCELFKAPKADLNWIADGKG